MAHSPVLGTPTRRTFWNRSPSPVGSRTPKRRPKDESLPVPSKVQRKLDVSSETSVIFEKLKTAVNSSSLGVTKGNEDELIAKSIAKFGFSVFHVAMCACKHVPEQFPDRYMYINNIIKEVNPDISESGAEELIRISSYINLNVFSPDTAAFQNILWKLSAKYSEPYINFLVPPVCSCIQDKCEGNVYPCSKSTVTVFRMTGPEPGLKCCLRCKECLTRYHIDMYTVPNVGKKLYPEKMELKSASNMTYLSEDTYELMCESSNHAFVSHKAFSAIYNGVFHENHPKARHFYQWQRLHKNSDEPLSDEDSIFTEVDNSDRSDDNLVHGLTGKMALNCFFRNELETELTERNMSSQAVFNKTNTQSTMMKEIDEMRRDELYTHECSENCKKKGSLITVLIIVAPCFTMFLGSTEP